MNDNPNKPRVAAVPPQNPVDKRKVAAKTPPVQSASPKLIEARDRPVHSWVEAGSHAQILQDMRRSRFRRFMFRFGLFVGLPSLLTLFYTLLWATPCYVSKFELTYQSYQPSTSLSTGLVQSLMGSSQVASVDYGTILYEYIRSPSLLRKLDEKLHLRAHDSARGIDFFSRLWANASDRQFLDYYLRQVSVSEGLGGYLTVEVEAFDPNYTLALAQTIAAECDDLIDGMSGRARREEVQFAEQQLARQEESLRKAQLALAEFRDLHGDLDPQQAATQLGQIAGGIESQLAAARSQLIQDLAYLKPNSVEVTRQKITIASLEDQLRAERDRLADPKGGPSYTQTLAKYEALMLDEQFASGTYQSASQGLEVARADAARKQTYVVDFSAPQLPDQATEPDPFRYTLTAFLISLVAFSMGSLLIGAFRDQAGM